MTLEKPLRASHRQLTQKEQYRAELAAFPHGEPEYTEGGVPVQVHFLCLRPEEPFLPYCSKGGSATRGELPLGWTLTRNVLRFPADLWRSACRPAIFRRCSTIGLIVGTLLSVINQGDAIFAGQFDSTLALRILANFLIPFVVSNLGAMSSLPGRPD